MHPEPAANMLESSNQWMRNSITFKLLSMAVVIILLIIPSVIISVLIEERSDTADEATEEVSQKWGLAQVITGPMLVVPFKELTQTAAGEVGSKTRHAYFLPESLQVDGTIDPSVRYRGIYEVTVYTADLSLRGSFAPPSFAEWEVDPLDILWNEAAVVTGIRDMRGINEVITLNWNGEESTFGGGIEAEGVVQTGVSARVDALQGGDFSFDLSLNGSQSIKLVPAGKETAVSLHSPWPSPKFDGAFLPDSREIDGEGFSADWRVLDLNRPYPQRWRDSANGIEESAFGVALVLPVDHYRKALRAARYAFIVITLTLLSFFLIEVRQKKRAHPFQYILVGLMLCLFYTLLLSISEHVSFNAAYALAGVATITAIAFYMQSVYHSRKLSMLTGGILITLYLFILLLLQMEDYALLSGSIGLFIALALTMYLTRNVQWYRQQ